MNDPELSRQLQWRAGRAMARGAHPEARERIEQSTLPEAKKERLLRMLQAARREEGVHRVTLTKQR
jgi:hypothetical protein